MTAMNVCYTCNDNYAMQTGVSILSLISNSRKSDEIRIYLIDAGILDSNLCQLKEICDKYNINLEIIQPAKVINRINMLLPPPMNDTNFISKIIRLFLGEILPSDLEKVLYIDSDTVITHSLDDLYDTEFQEPVAAVIDANFDFNYTEREYFAKSEYFNAGVLLIDLAKYRQVMKNQNIISILKKRPMFADQDVLNIIFKDNFYKLPPTYNSSIRYRLVNHTRLKKWMKWDQSPYSDQKLDEARTTPAIIHYTWSPLGRPWEKNNLDPDRRIWNEYYNLSPWAKLSLTVPEISKKKKIIRNIYNYCPIDFYMMVEYRYFKHDFLKNQKKEIS